MSRTPSAARIFSSPYEEINILFGLALVVLAAGEVLFGAPLSQTVKLVFFFSMTILLGSTGHIGLTLALMLMLPEAKEWLAIKTRNRPWIFWAKAGLVFSGTLLLALCAFDLLSVAGMTVINIAYIFLLLDWLLVIHHSAAQTHGLVVAYNQQVRKNGGPATSPRFSDRNRWLTLVMIACAFATPVLMTWSPQDSLARTVNLSLFAISALALAIYSYQSFFPWHSLRRNQSLYGARLLLFPLMPLSFFAGMGYRGIHSIEYIMVFRKCFEHSRKPFVKSTVIFITASIFLFFLALGIFALAKDSEFLVAAWKPQESMAAWIKVLAALNAACTFTHYYLDRIIFRMRDEDSRRLFGTLLSS
jgi:hypothetical protein